MNTHVIIPYRSSPSRERGFQWVTAMYRHRFPSVIVAIQDDDQPFNKSRLINAMVESLEESVLVIADADCFIADWSLMKAVTMAETEDHLIRPHNCICRTSAIQADWILRQNPQATTRGNWLLGTRKKYAAPGGLWVVRKSVFDRAGRMDEGYVGWGGEDNDMLHRVRHSKLPGPLYHIWHEAAPDRNKNPTTRRRYNQKWAKRKQLQ